MLLIRYYNMWFFFLFFFFFFFNDTATTEIYTLSLHDALPISLGARQAEASRTASMKRRILSGSFLPGRSEEHTSELQSRLHLVCRLLLEKKKKKKMTLFFYKKKKKNNTP